MRSIRLVFLALNIRLAMFAELQRPVLLEDESDTTETILQPKRETVATLLETSTLGYSTRATIHSLFQTILNVIFHLC